MNIAKFHSYKRAQSWCKGEKLWIVMGDTTDPLGCYWVVRPVDAARLARDFYFEILGR